jgi:glycine cleavage system aminomethyltransferase T
MSSLAEHPRVLAPVHVGLPHDVSVAAEMAVCRKAAGLVERTDLRRLELTGREAWLGHVLVKAIDAEAPEPGRARCVGARTWCCRLAPDRALLVGPPAALECWCRLAREAILSGHPIGCAKPGADAPTLSVVGPRAAAVLATVGVPRDLPLHTLTAALAGGVATTVLREDADRFLVVAGEGRAEVRRALLDAGRPLGLVAVGIGALGQLTAARRPALARR